MSSEIQSVTEKITFNDAQLSQGSIKDLPSAPANVTGKAVQTVQVLGSLPAPSETRKGASWLREQTISCHCSHLGRISGWKISLHNPNFEINETGH